MGRTREQIDIIIQGQDRASQVFASVNSGVQGLTSALTGGLFAMGVRELGQMAWSLAELGGQSARLETSFRNLAGVDPSIALQKLRAASKGTIDDAALLLGANKAMMLGVTDDLDTLSKLMEVAGVRAKAMGISTVQAYGDIITGIGRVSPLILDNLGILTGGQAGFAEYAKSIGKAASELTDIEKRQYLVNKVLADTTGIIQGQGKEARDMAGNLEYLVAQWNNMRAELGKGIETSGWAQLAGKGMGGVTEAASASNQRKELERQVSQYLGKMRELGALTAREFDAARSEITKLNLMFQQGLLPIGQYREAILALLPGIDAVNAALGVELPRNSALSAADMQAEKLEMRLYAAQAAAQALKSELATFDAEGLFRDVSTTIYGALAGAMGMPGNRTYTDMGALAKDAKDISDSQFRYALSLTDSNGQIALWQQRLQLVTKGSAEYYDILTRINNLQKGMVKTGVSSRSNELESMVSGILSPTQVTRQDVLATQFGEYYNQWDEYVRRLRSAATDANSAWKHMIPEDVLARGADYVEYWVQKQEQAFYSGQLTSADWTQGGVNWEGFDRQLQQAMAQKAAKDALMAQAMQRAQAMGLGGASRLEVASALGIQMDPRTEGVSAAAQFSLGVSSTDMGSQFTSTFEAQLQKQEDRWVSAGEWAAQRMFEGIEKAMSPARAEQIVDAMGPAILQYVAEHLGGRP